MATNVCVCADSLEVDGSGRLCVRLAPDSACQKNLLVVGDAGGLQVINKTYTLQRNSTAIATTVDLGSGNKGVARDMSAYSTTVDDGSAAGLWTIESDGSITVHCAGIYTMTELTVCHGATSHVVGGRARISSGADIIASHEFHDFSNTVDMAQEIDGPEFTCTNSRYLTAGTVLFYDSRVYAAVISGGITFDSEFTLTYLGAFA